MLNLETEVQAQVSNVFPMLDDKTYDQQYKCLGWAMYNAQTWLLTIFKDDTSKIGLVTLLTASVCEFMIRLSVKWKEISKKKKYFFKEM